MNLEQTMGRLATLRPVFHSEADVQHGLAWQIHSDYPEARIRLETRPRPGVRLDVLVVLDGRRIAFELKYLLRDLSVTFDDEVFELPNQSAQDVRRYDFIKDVSRLETLLLDGLTDEAYAVALTNDPSYWRGGNREDVVDAAFRLGEGRALQGAVAWATHTGAGTMRGREHPILLRGTYELRWRDFSNLPGVSNGVFRYLVVEVASKL